MLKNYLYAILIIPAVFLGVAFSANLLSDYSILTIVSLTLFFEILAVMVGTRILSQNNAQNVGMGSNRLFPPLFRIPSFRQVLFSLFSAIGFFFGLQVVALLIMTLSGSEGNLSSNTSVTLGTLSGFERILVLGFLVPVVVPMVEEWLFRGVIFGSLISRPVSEYHNPSTDNVFTGGLDNLEQGFRDVLPTAVFSALLFSFAHFQGFNTWADLLALLLPFLFGLFQAYSYFKYKNLTVPILTHMFYNGITSISISASF